VKPATVSLAAVQRDVAEAVRLLLPTRDPTGRIRAVVIGALYDLANTLPLHGRECECDSCGTTRALMEHGDRLDEGVEVGP